MGHYELILFFFGIAAIYSAAGFGGGSSYLAVLSLYSIPSYEMRVVALLCNLVVVSSNIWVFRRTGFLDFKKTWPLLVLSVPLAFVGAYMPIKEKTFMLLLGIALVLSAFVLFFEKNILEKKSASASENPEKTTLAQTGILGGIIGFFSGIVGIGGGIFLSPVLHFMRWDTPKHIAAAASLFIGANSISGLLGQSSNFQKIGSWGFYLLLLAAVFVGGQIGSRMSSLQLKQHTVRQVTALLTLYAGLNILLR